MSLADYAPRIDYSAPWLDGPQPREVHMVDGSPFLRRPPSSDPIAGIVAAIARLRAASRGRR